MKKPQAIPSRDGEMTGDGVFKMLTWQSQALTDMLGLPAIEGEPLQQESHKPQQRRTDSFFKLADGSFLHVEHQSDLSRRNELVLRLINYRLRKIVSMTSQVYQVIIFTGSSPKDRSKVLPVHQTSPPHRRSTSEAEASVGAGGAHTPYLDGLVYVVLISVTRRPIAGKALLGNPAIARPQDG